MVAPVPDRLPNLPSSFTHSTSPQFSSTFPRMLTPFLLITYIQTKYFHAVTHSFAQRRATIPFIPKSLRTLSIATGVYLESVPDDTLSHPQRRQLFCLHRLGASFSSLWALFCPRFLCFQSFAASFPKTPGWGYPDISEGHASGNISKPSFVSQRKYLPGAHCKSRLLEGPVREGEISP